MNDRREAGLDPVSLAKALKAALLEERDALSARDSAALDRAVDAKNRCLSRLSNADPVGEHAGPELQEFARIAEECDALNLANGAIVRLRQHQVAEALSVLRGADVQVATYGPAGATGSPSPTRGLAEA